MIMGAYTESKKQNAEDLHQERLYALKATAAARKENSPGTSWSRKFIVQSVIGSLFVFPMVLTLLNWWGSIYFGTEFSPVAIYVPEEVVNGGLFSWIFSSETIEYVPIHGFVLMPIHIAMTQVIGGFYFGASQMRRG